MIYVIGDIHGNHKGLIQVLKRSSFDYDKDTLITLGDIVDGYPDSFLCVEELLKIKNRIDIRGNHDDTFWNWIKGTPYIPYVVQGGLYTHISYANALDFPIKNKRISEMDSFGKIRFKHESNLPIDIIPDTHKEFFNNQVYYHIHENKAFVHGGYKDHRGLGYDDNSTYMWDRDLWYKHAMMKSQQMPRLLRIYEDIFIGHTNTMVWKTDKPMMRHNTINMDTDAGYNGRLSIMDIYSHEYWQSDLTKDLYPNIKNMIY